MNVANLREYARTLASQQEISEEAYKKLTVQCDAVKSRFMAAVDAVAQLYPRQDEAYSAAVAKLNSAIAGIDTLETKIDVELARLNTLIIRGQARIADLRGSTKNLMAAESYEGLDATSRQLLSDYMAEYKAANYTLWIKVLFLLGFMVVMRAHIRDILLLYVLLYLVIYIGMRFYTALATRSAGKVIQGSEGTSAASV